MAEAKSAPTHRRPLWEAAVAALAYAVLTVVMTWPLARGAARDVPADLGDSLLNMWIMAWVSDGVVAIARGQMAFADLWNANIFHPTPLTLTFSERLVPEALQGLPIYLATGNILLAYNVVLMATFVLSGLGMFLFVRELTGSARAAFVAGLFYAFVPYRWGALPHIQTLSSQWMPFVLLGLRRHFDQGRLVPLAWGTAAFVVQGLSSGYYLFYFAPVVLMYVLWELGVRCKLIDGRTWIALASAGGAALACTLPLLLPYAAARSDFGLTRRYEEVRAYSANVMAYLTAPSQLHVWGPILNRHPQPEGDLFPGALPIAAALAAVAIWIVCARRSSAALAMSAQRETATTWLARLAVAGMTLGIVVAVTAGVSFDIGGLTLRATSPRRPFLVAAIATVAWLIASPRPRAAVRAHASNLTPLLLIAALFSVAMSLGPEPRVGDRPLWYVGPYYAFFQLVPGFDGLRVPARYGMVAACTLAALAGYALAALARWRRGGTIALAGLAVAFLAESFAAPHAVNIAWRSNEQYPDPWPRVFPLNHGPLAYRHLLLMPEETIVLELPLGDAAWDLRYVYYAGLHGKRIVNGYSGYFPAGYGRRSASLRYYDAAPLDAWESVVASGASHVLLHETAYPAREWRPVAAWLERMGARLTVEFGDGARLFEVSPAASSGVQRD